MPSVLTGVRSHLTVQNGRLAAVAVLITVAIVGQAVIAPTAPAAAVADPGPPSAVATPVLTDQASSSGFPVGIAIFDSATLGQAVNPTGSLTFRLFGPGDLGCAGPPLLTTQTTVTGNGYYQSISFPTVLAGVYRWVASYSGDPNNAPATTACADASGQVAVAKRTPTLTATASAVSNGTSVTDTATLNGAGPNGPTGTLTFTLFGPA